MLEYVTYRGAQHSAQALEKSATDNLPLLREKIAKTYPSSLQPSTVLEINRCNSSENLSKLHCLIALLL